MTTLLTDQLRLQYFTGEKKNMMMKDCVDAANAIMIHSDGASPGDLIKGRRPSESEHTKNYREKIWKPVTKIPFNKIVTELQKIRKSEEWAIEYHSEDVSSKLGEGEKLQDYCEFKYPQFTSVTNWVFKVLLKKYLVDPNGVVVIYPKETVVAENEFLRPVATVFDCSQVIEFIENDYCIIKSKQKSTYTGSDGKSALEGEIYYVITTEYYQRWDETAPVNGKRSWIRVVDFQHGLGKMPAFKIGSIVKDIDEHGITYESRIHPCCIEFDEAVREYSDLQASKVLHLYPKEWFFQNQECKACNGTGKVAGEGGVTECKKCNGEGTRITNPYEAYKIKPTGVGENPIPTPPMGYADLNPEIIKLQNDHIDGHIYKGLSAINMEFLAQVPLTQSGVAKEVDRDGLNTFVNAVAEDLVADMDLIYYFINEMRNGVRIPDVKERLKQLPEIHVPEHFDFMRSDLMIDKLTKARNAKIKGILVAEMELEYANSAFNSDPDVKKRMDLIYTLDPFAGIGEDEKQTMLVNGGISKEDYVVSCNIQQFVDKAMAENKGFPTLDIAAQQVIIHKYAADQIAAAAASTKVMQMVQPGGNPGAAPNGLQNGKVA